MMINVFVLYFFYKYLFVTIIFLIQKNVAFCSIHVAFCSIFRSFFVIVNDKKNIF